MSRRAVALDVVGVQAKETEMKRLVIDCAMPDCFTPAVPRSQWCSAHSLQVQRVRGYMAEAESVMTSKPSPPATDSRIYILSALRKWLTRPRP